MKKSKAMVPVAPPPAKRIVPYSRVRHQKKMMRKWTRSTDIIIPAATNERICRAKMTHIMEKLKGDSWNTPVQLHFRENALELLRKGVEFLIGLRLRAANHICKLRGNTRLSEADLIAANDIQQYYNIVTNFDLSLNIGKEIVVHENTDEEMRDDVD